MDLFISNRSKIKFERSRIKNACTPGLTGEFDDSKCKLASER